MPHFLRPGLLDLVDILLVSWLLYRFLLLIQGTRAAHMVVGLILLLLGSVVAQVLNLRGMSWIISSVRIAWVVAVAVIFQPELRRGLAQLGQNPIIRRVLRVENPQAADALGVNVAGLRYFYTILGGALIGMAGPVYSLSVKAGWKGTITGLDGIGWIALSITIFGGWNPLRAAVGSYLFALLQWAGFLRLRCLRRSPMRRRFGRLAGRPT